MLCKHHISFVSLTDLTEILFTGDIHCAAKVIVCNFRNHFSYLFELHRVQEKMPLYYCLTVDFHCFFVGTLLAIANTLSGLTMIVGNAVLDYIDDIHVESNAVVYVFAFATFLLPLR